MDPVHHEVLRILQAEQQARHDFELLLRRPPNYFKLSGERQWQIDKDLGVLDAWVSEKYISDEMKRRWKDHFGV